MKNQKIIVLQVDLADDPTKIKDYIDYHSNVWPEVIQDLKDILLSPLWDFGNC